MTDTADRLRRLYNTWNNPPSPELPEGAGLLLEAADEIDRMRTAIFDLVNMERTVTPDMGGKKRTFAYMRNGKVLAECLDRARSLLPYDMQPTDPRHGGKVSP